MIPHTATSSPSNPFPSSLMEHVCLYKLNQWRDNLIESDQASPEDIRSKGSFEPPDTWELLAPAFLELMMLANGVQENARDIAIFN